MLTVEEAQGRVLAEARPLGAEEVLLLAARGRVLAETVVATRSLPPWDNSAMDGYAVRAAEVSVGRPMPVAFTVGAGHEGAALPAGAAARIMTGAPVPAGADAIIMREDAEEHPGRREVVFKALPESGQHVRRMGEDVAAGALVLRAGAVIGAGEIGLLASLGRTIASVHRRPRVAIVSTGDELVPPDRAPVPGAPGSGARIVASNGWALAALCAEAGAEATVLPAARDDLESIRAAFAEGLRADVVISTGGVSVGDFDFVKPALESLGVTLDFWKVAMKPGKPVTFGAQGGRPLFGLPGNPASSMVTFELFVRPALRRLLGFPEAACFRPRAEVILDADYDAGGGRRHFLRARVRREGARLVATPNARQGSGMLRSMIGVNALLDVAEKAAPLPAGAVLSALLLEAL